ncbi:hypothetical protein ACTL6P_06575 [Endozoicomonas acroporae]|uniref:hypothetical protein n=1 Tax=Endozoicomonas acroporae TaxID=1701104 RepID=UPI000C75CD21|nr:hypothetical protein [Endozoicomonas acroporae]
MAQNAQESIKTKVLEEKHPTLNLTPENKVLLTTFDPSLNCKSFTLTQTRMVIMGYDFQMKGYGDDTFVNCSYNVTPMFCAAKPGAGIHVIEGMTGSRAVKPLLEIRNYMVENRAAMEALNPPNGYGSYHDTVYRVLDRLITISQYNPEGIWEIL